MSCIRCSRLLHKPLLRAVTVSRATSSGGGGEESDDGVKAKPVPGLMNALKGLKVDGALPKAKIGFSAAGAFRKRQLQKAARTTAGERSPTKEVSEDENKIQQATREVAKIFPDEKKAQAELLEQLKRMKSSPEDPGNISDVLTGLKVKRSSELSDEELTTHDVPQDPQSHLSFDGPLGSARQTPGGRTRVSERRLQTPMARQWATEGEESDTTQQATQEVPKDSSEEKEAQAELLAQLTKEKTSLEDPESIRDVLAGISIKRPRSPGSAEDGLSTDHGPQDRDSLLSFDAAFKDARRDPDEQREWGRGMLSPQLGDRNSLFGHGRLNVFKPLPVSPTDVESGSQRELSIWEREAERVKKELLAETIRNGFEEMIEMTREGKLWTYPIDNEKGLEEEQKVPFYEHVFLDDHLEGFPDIPEVMNFMELVLIGLSKNPYLNVEQKREHIDWFREYFNGKLEVLKESTAATATS